MTEKPELEFDPSKIPSFDPMEDSFEYLFMFWLCRHLPAKQVLNSKQPAKGYERII